MLLLLCNSVGCGETFGPKTDVVVLVSAAQINYWHVEVAGSGSVSSAWCPPHSVIIPCWHDPIRAGALEGRIEEQ